MRDPSKPVPKNIGFWSKMKKRVNMNPDEDIALALEAGFNDDYDAAYKIFDKLSSYSFDSQLDDLYWKSMDWKARTLVMKEEYRQALEIWDYIAKTEHGSLKGIVHDATDYAFIALCHKELGEYSDSVINYLKAIDDFDNIKWDNDEQKISFKTALYAGLSGAYCRFDDEIISDYDDEKDTPITLEQQKEIMAQKMRSAKCSTHDDLMNKAIEYADMALKLTPDDVEAYVGKIIALGKLQEHKEAILLCREALEIGNENAESDIRNEYGLSLQDLGAPKFAIQQFQKIILEDADDDRAWYNLACCYAQLDQKDLAINALSTAKNLDPDGTHELMVDDEDLNNIRDMPEFQKMISRGPDYQWDNVFTTEGDIEDEALGWSVQKPSEPKSISELFPATNEIEIDDDQN